MDSALNGRVMTIDKSTIASLISSLAVIEKQNLLKTPIAKNAVFKLSTNLAILFEQLESTGHDQVFCRIARSAQVTHDNYFEYVKVGRGTGKTKSIAIFEALNYVQEASSSKAVLKIMSESASDDSFEFIIRVTQMQY